MRTIEQLWFKPKRQHSLLALVLTPLVLVFWLISTWRCFAYNIGLSKSYRAKVPVLIVGNISVGGNGKTPVVLYLLALCQQLGIKAGVISRGYGGKAEHYPLLLTDNTTVEQAGDEAFMIYLRTKALIAVGADRVKSAQLLTEQGCQLLICDDGMQHYRLKRDAEWLIVDAKRQFGNGCLLPLGPLREGKWRLNTVDLIIANHSSEMTNKTDITTKTPVFDMHLAPQQVVNLMTGERLNIADFLEQHHIINAIAAIGSPERFFTTLNQLGFSLNQQQGFNDHHRFSSQDFIDFSSDLPLLMTEKDAVKCQSFAQQNWWYLTVDASFSATEQQQLIKQLQQLVQRGHHGI